MYHFEIPINVLLSTKGLFDATDQPTDIEIRRLNCILQPKATRRVRIGVSEGAVWGMTRSDDFYILPRTSFTLTFTRNKCQLQTQSFWIDLESGHQLTMAKHGPVGDLPVMSKIVLVTGGGSGIGFSFARLCHEKGARVLIGDLKLTPEAQQYLSSHPDSDIKFETCDVTSWNSLHNLVSASVKTFGDVPDVYTPIAGVFDPSWSNFWDDTEEDSYKTVQINVEHPIKLTRLAMRALLSANKKGVVCLVASTAGIRGNYFAPLYATTKHAIVGFAKSMSQADPDEGVRIVCVLPGTVQSPLWEDRDDDVAKATKYSERKLMPPSTIADAMIRMIESKEYSGGTCLLKTIAEERVVEGGWDKSAGKYDPSPRPEADLGHIKGVLEGERGRPWKE